MKTLRSLAVVFGFAVLVVTGCGKSGGSSGPVSLSISPAEVVSGSCLNLERLLDRTSAFPADTVGRLYSTDIRVQAAGARDVFASLATRSDFKFEEASYRDLMEYNHEIHFSTAKQNDCSRVTLYNADGAPEDYAIVSATPDDLILSDDADSKTAEISLAGPREIKLVISYSIVDICNGEKPATVQTTQMIEWNKGAFPTSSREQVSMSMLQSVAATTDSPPAEIEDSLSTAAASGNETASVSAAALAQLRVSPVKTSLLACFPPPKKVSEGATSTPVISSP